ncbi:MAG: SGNH/GDSL hydrolase family protein [Bosea sp. (in: a-proteobacteria)]|uniref:SGNH/GDSL hydrolase family protein n=1 Tax=Bosea sp. (in: a-proteobacteria) TaxID=1871050 RepID=UPI0027365517|nr:SGNH/GDSL hydrolase family protein [Bosea sp. (in: a-proteobacteria)]MDP3255293.1 SGNH/GDSL hydrolase family protein [Bosea sp. (in: a-proteobacteria)]MDP3319091.1 SGNH/GDSL hydrolase family protein [Bosea sp. (in: a-proteobacteria)]
MTHCSLTRSPDRRNPIRPDGASARRWLLALLAVVPLALAFGSLAGVAIGRIANAAPSYRDQRLAQVSADLRRVDGNYLLALGDSHVARWHARELCGLPLINAGLHGATTADADAFLARLTLPHPPRAIILAVGTNDANRKRFREPPEAVIRFQHAFRALLRRLVGKSELVIVATLPRIEPSQELVFSGQVAADIAASAEAACRTEASCRIEDRFGRGMPRMDGLHLADYERAYRDIAPAICGAIASDRADGPPPGQTVGAGRP